MTLGSKGLCAYSPDMRLYEHGYIEHWTWLHHARTCSDGKPRWCRPASLRECCTWLSCLQDSVDYVHGGDPYRRPRDCRQIRCLPDERCPNLRPCASHFLPFVVAVLDAQRTGNVCINLCRLNLVIDWTAQLALKFKVHLVILAHALNKYCVIPFIYYAPNKEYALISQVCL